jgi:histidinol-phosphate/aromatic aminotransferase/cobyric acid decarboxylase-like protein
VGYPGHLRISVGAPEQNARLLAALDFALAR